MTNDDFKKIIPLYLGCTFMYRNRMGGDIEYDEIIPKTIQEYLDNDFAEIKIILRPLDSMTEYERMLYLLLEFGNLPKIKSNAMDKGCIRWETENGINYLPLVIFRPDQFLWLLSKGFDLFNLIEEGYAVKKEV